MQNKRTLVIACGALAREIHQLKQLNGWEHMDLTCIDAALHFHPEKIGAALRERIRKKRDEYDDMYIAYAECGSRGEIDRIAEEEGLERLPGAHCYQFFAGDESFAAMSAEELGTFYLTDFLVRHFERLVVTSLGLDRHPELRDMYFGNYKRLIYLAQTHDEALEQQAREAAAFLGLEYELRFTGYGDLETGLRQKLGSGTNG